MRVLALVCVVLFVSGCLVDGSHKQKNKGERASKQGSKVKINVGDEEETSIPWSKCEKLLTKNADHTPYGSSHIIERDYKHKKSCVRLVVGTYGKLQRHEMDNSPVAGGMFTQVRSGSFEAARSFMESRSITCKESNSKLSLVFPDRNHGHADYETVGLQCGDNVRELLVRIGLADENSDKLAITVVPRREDEASPVFHAFDTDNRGVIKKHVKVVGYGGVKEVMLDNYEKQ